MLITPWNRIACHSRMTLGVLFLLLLGLLNFQPDDSIAQGTSNRNQEDIERESQSENIAGSKNALAASSTTASVPVETPFNVRAMAVDGETYGVGVIEIPEARTLEMGWYPDQTIRVKSSQSTIWLPAITELKTDLTSGQPKNEDRLLVYFLYSGNYPTTLDVTIAGEFKFTVVPEHRHGDPIKHGELISLWWTVVCETAYRGISATLTEPTDDFLAVLGRRLRLIPKHRASSRTPEASQLEVQFERTLGMLLGFESVRLAMMIDDAKDAIGHAPAVHPLPGAVNVASWRLPESNSYASPVIEPIASMVPSDCFYVRCGSIQNYTWLRRFLQNWGGSLDEIVTSPSLDTEVRGRLESQLGISTQQSLESGMDALVSDIAIIGTDVFFEEGAGIGVLLEAKPGQEQKVEALVQQQRRAARSRGGAIVQSELVHGQLVSFQRSADHRTRSLFVRIGRYLLVTNSQELMNRVLKLRTTSQSLANLSEYRYANATNPTAHLSGIKIYLSDPFFRRLTSPAFRIELGRRRAAAKDCRQLEIAALVAGALGHKADTRQSLIQGGFLPEEFGLRPDGSHAELVVNEALDSLRGRVGTFIPVADVIPGKANQNELLAYQRFSNRYRQEWPSMDPVLACIKSTPLDKGVERVQLQIHVTPYARKEYGFLAAYLAEPSSTHAAISGEELLGVSAHLRNNSRRFLAHFGLCDTAIPFEVRQGELRRDGEHASESLVQQRSFAAVTPAGREGLQVLAGLVKSLQTRESDLVPPSTLAPSASPIFGLNPSNIVNGIMSPTEVAIKLSEIAFRSILAIASLRAIYEDGEWSIYGSTSDLRHEVRQRLVQRQLPGPTSVYLHAGGVEQSAIAPYLHAYSYCEARQQSAANAAWLNRWTNGLRAEPQAFRTSLERAIHGTLKCPLGGEFVLKDEFQSTHPWTSSKWRATSLSAVNSVPSDYRFPLIQWLKSLELNFNLNAASLNSDIVLHVAKTLDADSPAN